MSFSRENPPESLCLIRLSAIGDCCHTVPVVRTLQTCWPDTAITWIIGRTEHALLEGLSGVEFITFNKGNPRASRRLIRRELRGRRFPLLLHMHPSMRANLVSLNVRANYRLGLGGRVNDYQWLFVNARTAAKDRVHVMDRFFGFCEYFGLTERALHWDIPVSEADRQWAAATGAGSRPLVVISPCANARFRNYRNWRAENYAALARWLIEEQSARILVTGGPTEMEREYGRVIASAAGNGATDLVGQTSLKQLLALIGQADLLICPDSGPAHMATAVGTPVVGLYATTNRHRAAPYFCQDLVVDRYPEAVQKEYGKTVAQMRWGTRVRDPSAMDLITLDDVTAKVETALANLGNPAWQGPRAVG